MVCEAKNLDTPDDKRNFEHGQIQLVNLPGTTFARAVLSRGLALVDRRQAGGRHGFLPGGTHRCRDLRSLPRADGRRNGTRHGAGGRPRRQPRPRRLGRR